MDTPKNPDNPARRQYALEPGTFAPGETDALAADLRTTWQPPKELVRAWQRRGEDPLAHERAEGWPLRFLQIEVVNVCNYRCPLCGTLARDGVTRRRMTLDEFTRVIQPVASDLLGVVLYGNRGEPLLNPELAAMIQFVSTTSRAKTSLSTNGSKVDADAARALMQAGLSQLIFAIDGISEASYGAYRVGGDLQTVLANLRSACAVKRQHGYSTRIVWQFIPMATNEHERDDVSRLGYEMGVDEVRFKISRSVSASETFRPANAANRTEGTAASGRFDCPYGLDKLYVDPNGDCYPCCYAEGNGLLVGNALETPLNQLWQSDEMWTLRRSFVTQQGFHAFCSAKCNTGARREAAPLVFVGR